MHGTVDYYGSDAKERPWGGRSARKYSLVRLLNSDVAH
jgi:hypothetical protein